MHFLQIFQCFCARTVTFLRRCCATHDHRRTSLHLHRTLPLAFFLACLTLAIPRSACAWPLDSQWVVLTNDGQPVSDPETDKNGAVNIVGDSTNPAAYTFNDGAYLYFRLRLDATPLTNQGDLRPFGWGILIDSNQNADNYEWMIMANGILNPDGVSIEQNTDQGVIGDPSDAAEVQVAQYPVTGHVQALVAPSTFSGDADYFLDFRIPYTVFLALTGLNSDSLVRYFIGTSQSAHTLSSDLVGTDLYDGLGDPVTPGGTTPAGSDGIVRFIVGSGDPRDLELARAGQPLTIQVDDPDQTYSANPSGVLHVLLTTPAGDNESLALSATAISGRYIGQIATAIAAASPRDGVLQVADGIIVTVTYTDMITAGTATVVPRTDTILVTTQYTDIAVGKTVDKPLVAEGDRLTFTLSATNFGPFAANNVQVNDPLPAGLILDSTKGDGSYVGSVWIIGTLAVGASATIEIDALAGPGTNGSTLTNTATLDAAAMTPIDIVPGNNNASVDVNVGGANLALAKTADLLDPDVGDAVTFTIELRNYGPLDANGIVLTDLLPTGLSYASHSGGSSYDPVNGDWVVGALAAGAKLKLTLVANVDAGTEGQILIQTVSRKQSTPVDPVPGNDSASVTLHVGFADLALDKSVPPPGTLAPSPGATVTFNLLLTNHGPHDATGISIVDTLPVGLTYIGSSGSGSTSWNAGNRQLTWTLATLASGAAETLTVSATVDTGTAGQSLTNLAVITSSDQGDADTTNNSDFVTLKISGTDLALSKTASTLTPNAGSTLTYTVTLTNNGPNTATGITVSDPLPVGVTHSSDAATVGNPSYSNSTRTVAWNVNSLAAGSSETMTIVVTVDAGTTGQTLINPAFISARDQDDPNDANDTASYTVYVGGTDLAVAKAVSTAQPAESVDFTYTLSLTNNGPNPASNVEIRDLLPPEIVYIGNDAASPQSYDPVTGIWTVPALAVGSSTQLNLTVQVLSGLTQQTLTNIASLFAADQADIDPTNDSSSVDVQVGATDLAIAKVVDNPAPTEGETVLFTVTVTNLGANSASGVEIEDFLPVGLTLMTATPSQGTFVGGLWSVGTLAPYASSTLQLAVLVGTGTAGSTVTNSAALTILDQIDTNPANDSASADITPVAPPPLSIVKWSTAAGGSAKPGQAFTYWIQVDNGGSASASNVFVDDLLSPYLYLAVDTYGAGVHVNFVEGVPASGLTPNATLFSQTSDTVFGYTPSSGANGAPAGTDGFVTNWRQTFSGTMNPGGRFFLQFQVQVR